MHWMQGGYPTSKLRLAGDPSLRPCSSTACMLMVNSLRGPTRKPRVSAYQQVSQVAESKQSKGRSYAGFNPARRDDVRLFAAVLSGDHLLRGFRNGDIRLALWRTSTDPDEL